MSTISKQHKLDK